jgi:MFS family permease
MGERLSARLAPFRHKHFRNLFLAQTLSLVGTWSHDLARSWIIVSATGSSGALGNINLAIAVPCLFLILQGGVLVDRADVRKLIERTKTALGVSAIVLACIAEFSQVQIWQLLVFGLIEGMIIAFDSPAFAALTVKIVPKHDFQQAIALNSTNFHTSRMLGPIVAAWLMAFHGPALVFLFDALTYFGVAFVLSRMEYHHAPIIKEAPRAQLRDGLRYIFRHPLLRYRVIQLMLTISCIYPMMNAVFRAYVQQKFNLNAHEFGAVFSLPAFGSLCGALSFAVIKPARPIRALYFGIPMVTVCLLILPFMSDLTLTTALMSLTGFGVYLSFASLTVSMQLDVAEPYRGRLSSVIGMGFAAIGPLMCFPWGHLADYIGAPTAIVSSALIFGTGSAVLAFNNRKIIAPPASHHS